MGLTYGQGITRKLWEQGLVAYCGKCGHRVPLNQLYRKPSGQVLHSYCNFQVKLKAAHSSMSNVKIDLNSIPTVRKIWPAV